MTLIGIDPHKATHTAVAIDSDERPLAQLQVRADRAQTDRLLAWAAGFEERTWAIESAGGLGYLLAQQLVARGEHVVDVPATLSARAPGVGLGAFIEERLQRRIVRRGGGATAPPAAH